MAVAANSLRLSLRACSHAPAVKIGPRAARQAFLARRALSTTVSRQADETEDAKRPATNPAEKARFQDLLTYISNQRKLSEEELKDLNAIAEEPFKDYPEEIKQSILENGKGLSKATEKIRRPIKPKKDAFWNEGETDQDLITDEIGEDDFEEDDMMSMAHAKLEEHREYREYARIAVWEMPLLSRKLPGDSLPLAQQADTVVEFAKPFEPPTEKQVLRFRYTTYMGEFHPADRKVVVEFSPKDLTDLTEAQQLKLMKLAGPRYNPSTEIIKMSCERFEHQAQNKRYLGDTVNKMIETAKVWMRCMSVLRTTS